MAVFEYDQSALEYLGKKDKKLGAAINRIGLIERQVIPDLFAALVHSIVSQQISGPAAATVWRRILDYFGTLTPEKIGQASCEEIQQLGISMRKARYIKGVAQAALEGRLDLQELNNLPDEDVIKRLVSLPGVGVWTAEMMLIFSLQRPDVVSWGDYGIRKGMMKLYGLDELTREQFDKYRKRYSPYGSVASLYLWEIAAGR
ncbi:MAG TPA: DNA-3-methyladenine glycosylase [Syntrophomonadaceae bacterium]|jgi:DNA-3-methyladenine glycosylase II|nr:DNA-3-methyladenine glycosylase [Syntrophomonadaceae bacterium]HPU49303.1 DNA-3-methyladenine glycosylase [Syntrophomonadaceae bacterium]